MIVVRAASARHLRPSAGRRHLLSFDASMTGKYPRSQEAVTTQDAFIAA